MTALDRYVRLEATGLWREGRETPPREVIVSFGNATLILRDLAGAPLGHWALAGVAAVGRGGAATVYAMSADAETLAIDDAAMVAAIDAVTRVGRVAPRRRRRRLPLTGLFIVAALAAVAWAAPRYIRPDPELLVPPDRAAEFGDRMLLALVGRYGAPCDGRAGGEALARLSTRLAPEAPPRIRIMPLGGTPTAALPGGTILLDSAVADAPAEVLAGWAALALGREPVRALLAEAGRLADARYLVTGDFPDADLAGAAAAALAPPAPAEAAPALARLVAARIDPAPFAAALAAAGLAAEAAPPASVVPIPERDRAALAAICTAGGGR
jgi:hypothetical protein